MCSVRVTEGLFGQNLVPDPLFLSGADLKRAGEKAPNQDFELREASLDFSVLHEDGARVNEYPDPEPPQVNGMIEIEASSGGGKVRKSSVATHCAL